MDGLIGKTRQQAMEWLDLMWSYCMKYDRKNTSIHIYMHDGQAHRIRLDIDDSDMVVHAERELPLPD